MPAATIYKLLTRAEWEAAQTGGVYRGSAHDVRDGFIHFSTAAQLAATARKYFAGVPDLVLLAVDVEVLTKAPSPLSPLPRGERRTPSQRAQPAPSPLAGEGWGEGEKLRELRWEPARDGDLFPHLYADLPISAVKSATAIPLAADGVPILPAGLEP
jgi:uncharacterized protein (DUF952 family)